MLRKGDRQGSRGVEKGERENRGEEYADAAPPETGAEFCVPGRIHVCSFETRSVEK